MYYGFYCSCYCPRYLLKVLIDKIVVKIIHGVFSSRDLHYWKKLQLQLTAFNQPFNQLTAFNGWPFEAVHYLRSNYIVMIIVNISILFEYKSREVNRICIFLCLELSLCCVYTQYYVWPSDCRSLFVIVSSWAYVTLTCIIIQIKWILWSISESDIVEVHVWLIQVWVEMIYKKNIK
jgi:hypothetical protein